MSLNVTLFIASWTAVGAAAGGTMRSISAKYLTEPAAFRPSLTTARARVDGSPRSPPSLGLTVGQVVTTATLFGLLAWRFRPHLDLIVYSYLAAFGVPLAVIDALELRLPRQLVLPMYPTCVAFLGLAAAMSGDGARFVRAVAGMIVLVVAYLATAVLSHGGLGAGDVRVAGPIGLTLAWLGWPTLLAGTIFSFLFFTVTAVLTAGLTSSSLRRELPFGPAMFGGAFFAILTPHL